MLTHSFRYTQCWAHDYFLAQLYGVAPGVWITARGRSSLPRRCGRQGHIGPVSPVTQLPLFCTFACFFACLLTDVPTGLPYFSVHTYATSQLSPKSLYLARKERGRNPNLAFPSSLRCQQIPHHYSSRTAVLSFKSHLERENLQ